ncbi:putative transposase [Trichonephila inaurata madagascariensis]|uniref:Putative transposase n=1 Tax=Trichonephila inaurata madagascariensis TaxID=2747483 RepID=A0A8X7CV35_9ARAC|nr:putative transposase [Trichonephila inaurata madagascariensis]
MLKVLKTQILLKKKGYDTSKKISGIKRHIAVDTQGLPHAIHITTAEATDRSSAVKMVKNAKANLSEVKNILVDAGYTGENFATQIKKTIGATVEVIKRSELHTFVVLPKRWVVERSFAWLEKFDTQGLPHAIHITTAEATDRSSAVKMVKNAKANLSEVKNILVDAGYTGENFATQIKKTIGATVEVIKRSELHTFVVLPKRWVVERSFAWLEKCRRLWKNCERKLNTSLQMIVLSFISLLLRRF